jgi:23S rRNA (pseudouridine1915-N3)-methyltransferase
MIPIRLYAFGKMKDARLSSLAEDYSQRMSRWAKLEVKILRDGKASDPVSRLREEAATLRQAAGWDKNIPDDVVLFDERGKDLTSEMLAEEIGRRRNSSRPMIAVLGSSHGVDGDLKKAIRHHWRLSGFTLTHEWARALALEQFYRALTLLEGIPYHH